MKTLIFFMLVWYYIIKNKGVAFFMKCKNCGASVLNDAFFCSECGHKIKPRNNLKSKKNLKILIIIAISLILIVILFYLFKPKRSEVLNSLTRNDYYKFTINDKEYYLGEKVSNLENNELYYDINFNNVVYADSISTRTFFNLDNKELFLAALYCSSLKNCTHEDSTLVKVNFYKNSNVLVNDFIKYGITYQEVIDKYGKEDGYFYQDEDMLVWTFGDNDIGDPYYILKFDDASLFSNNQIIEIRIGVWWYDKEYEHTVLKKDIEEVKN